MSYSTERFFGKFHHHAPPFGLWRRRCACLPGQALETRGGPRDGPLDLLEFGTYGLLWPKSFANRYVDVVVPPSWNLCGLPETTSNIPLSRVAFQDGRSFIIQNQAQFARDLLPLNYKHNNMASFIRQLNMCEYFVYLRSF